MSNFVLFHVYLILMITSLIISIQSLLRRNNDMLGAMVILFFTSIVGLSCNYAGFVREFCGLYGIVLSG